MLAFVFVSIASITDNPIYDAIGSICIGIILIIIAIFIAWRIKALIVGHSAEPELEAMIVKIIAADENIECLLNSMTLQFSLQVMLAAKLKMKSGINIDIAVKHINELERKIKQQALTVG